VIITTAVMERGKILCCRLNAMATLTNQHALITLTSDSILFFFGEACLCASLLAPGDRCNISQSSAMLSNHIFLGLPVKQLLSV